MKKSKIIKIGVFPQKGFEGIYFNVYRKKEFIGTINEADLESLVGYDTDVFVKAYGSKIKVEENKLKFLLSSAPKKPSKSRVSKFKAPFEVYLQEERDNVDVYLIDADEDIVAEWHDDDARQMFEDGFFYSQNIERSVIEYAMANGLI